MPDPNNPLETALRDIKNVIGIHPSSTQMATIRKILIELLARHMDGF